MAQDERSRFPHFDPAVAEGLARANEQVGGLPGFLGIRLTAVDAGYLRAELEVKPELLNPFGMLHGGVLAALVDHVLGSVLYPVIPRGHWAATTEFKLNYLAAVRGGTLVAESRIVSLTRSTAVVRIDVSNEGRLAGVAQGTVLIREPRGTSGS